MSGKTKYSIKNNNGITLIALVVTIVLNTFGVVVIN